MIRSMKDLTKYSFQAKDGDAGRVHDFYFDDVTWTVRYLVVDTGRWLPGRLILLSPLAIGDIDWKTRHVHLDVTKKDIEKSPDVAQDQPVSRQAEIALHEHYGWPPYWAAAPAAMGAPTVMPAAPPSPKEEAREKGSATATADDPHLRSVLEVTGYDIQATDGSLGMVSDFVCEDGSWIIRYLVIDTRKWLPGRKVLVSPEWTERIDWDKNDVVVDMSREEIQHSPPFDPDAPINRQYEERLYDFFGRPKYWQSEL
jgi:hypothetical protein